MFEGNDIAVFATNGNRTRNIIAKQRFKIFHESTWGIIGLEMEGSYYQKRFNRHQKSEKSVPHDVKVRYAYYALIIHLKPEHSSVRRIGNYRSKTYVFDYY
jgi:hypothetical protein